MPSRGLGRWALGALLVLLLAACGEPAVDVDVPARASGEHLLDEVGLLDPAIEERLAAVSEATGFDVVGLIFEDEASNRGQAHRGGQLLLEEWDADIVLVAVGGPGDFESVAADRNRAFGVYATDRFSVSRGLRERIILERAQLPAAENEWDAAFAAAIEELELGLADGEVEAEEG